MLAECIESKVLDLLTEVNKKTLLWTRAFGPFIGSVFNLVGEGLGVFGFVVNFLLWP